MSRGADPGAGSPGAASPGAAAPGAASPPTAPPPPARSRSRNARTVSSSTGRRPSVTRYRSRKLHFSRSTRSSEPLPGTAAPTMRSRARSSSPAPGRRRRSTRARVGAGRASTRACAATAFSRARSSTRRSRGASLVRASSTARRSSREADGPVRALSPAAPSASSRRRWTTPVGSANGAAAIAGNNGAAATAGNNGAAAIAGNNGVAASGPSAGWASARAAPPSPEGDVPSSRSALGSRIVPVPGGVSAAGPSSVCPVPSREPGSPVFAPAASPVPEAPFRDPPWASRSRSRSIHPPSRTTWMSPRKKPLGSATWAPAAATAPFSAFPPSPASLETRASSVSARARIPATGHLPTRSSTSRSAFRISSNVRRRSSG